MPKLCSWCTPVIGLVPDTNRYLWMCLWISYRQRLLVLLSDRPTQINGRAWDSLSPAKQIPLVNVLDRSGRIGDMSVNTGFSPFFLRAATWRILGAVMALLRGYKQARQQSSACSQISMMVSHKFHPSWDSRHCAALQLKHPGPSYVEV